MPGTFLYGSIAALDILEGEDALRSFVGTVLRWVEDSTDVRAIRIRANWQAITNADPQEVAFCQAAGRMGLDPYNLSSWPTGLVDLLETLGEQDPPPIVTDFLSAATAENAALLWQWVNQVRQAGSLGRAPKPPPLPLKLDTYAAGQAGATAAYRLRQQLHMGNSTLPSVESVADEIGLGPIVFEEYNHRPDLSIRAAVGWQAGDKAVVLGSKPPTIESQRFLLARGLFHATFMCQRSARLITRTHDWDQQASRGFAAELLAPRAALAAKIPGDLDEDERADAITSLAENYQVHPELIRRQLQNAARFGLQPIDDIVTG
jgi:Zn-dependent peptidase ImmA (M78 family)